jgi:hypothetical protein
MRVKGTETTQRSVVVDVNVNDVLEQIRGDVYRSLGMPTDAYLNREGFLVEDEEHYHGSDTQKIITQKPSEIQVKTIEAFRHIYAMMIRD